MAFFLTSKGEIVEGTELTVEEVQVRESLPVVINGASYTYIPGDNLRKMVDAILAKFHVSPRPVDEVEQPGQAQEEALVELPVVEAPEPFVPVVAEVEEVPFG